MNYSFDCTPNPSTDLVELMEKTKRSQMIKGASSVITNAVSRVHAGASNLYDTTITAIIKQAPIFMETNITEEQPIRGLDICRKYYEENPELMQILHMHIESMINLQKNQTRFYHIEKISIKNMQKMLA